MAKTLNGNEIIIVPVQRLSENEIDALARDQAEAKHKRKKRKGPKPKKIVFVDSKGYPRILLRRDGLRDKRLHELLGEAMLGRELLPGETVHHKDGDFLNFHWTNLVVLNESDHGCVSSKQKYYFKIMGITIDPLKPREAGEDDDDYDENAPPPDEKVKAPF